MNDIITRETIQAHLDGLTTMIAAFNANDPRTINVPGYPLMVRAVDYNTLSAQLAEAQRELVAKEAERAAMELERNNAQRQHTMQGAINKIDSQRIPELTAQLAEAQKDAERWRRAAQCARLDQFGGFVVTPDEPAFAPDVSLAFTREIDAAIDAAKGESNA